MIVKQTADAPRRKTSGFHPIRLMSSLDVASENEIGECYDCLDCQDDCDCYDCYDPPFMPDASVAH